MKKISVIIPVLNEQKTIQGLLEQLQSLSRQGHEIIVIDGGSSDGTLAHLKSLPNRSDVPFYHNLLTAKPGRAQQMNLGAANATGDLLWFLHADSIVSGTLIEQITQTSGLWGWCNVKLDGKSKSFRLIESMMNFRARLTRVATGDQGLYVDKNVFQKAGAYPDIALMEDVALSKILKKIAKPVILNERLVSSSRRWEQGGIWRTVLLMWRLRWAYFWGKNPDALSSSYRESR